MPTNVKAIGDDRVITVTWNNVNNASIVGYYVTWKKVGAASVEGVKQTVYTSAQIQPVDNGQVYEISVQSARGTYLATAIGPLNVSTDNDLNRFARGDGNVSTVTTVNATPTSARVDAQRSRLTGFFDDFNVPANPMDELKWNNVAMGCAEVGGAGQFINAQYHAHNMIRSGWCDRGGQVARPRATFDMSSATEANPAQVEFDVDGVSFGRDAWYIDFLPIDSRRSGLPLDLTSHVDTDDADKEDPGNIVRVNLKQGTLTVNYYTPLRNEDISTYNNPINITTAACPAWWQGPAVVNLQGCDMSRKTAGLSPIEQSTAPIFPTVPNVRRHWIVQLTPTKIKIFTDGTLIAEGNLPAAFAAKKQFTLHSTLFSYNTGKDFNALDRNQNQGIPVAFPYIQMLHWDNFGFSGPPTPIEYHNYIDGGSNGTTPAYFVNEGANQVPRGQRTTIIPVPNPIGNLIDSQGHLYFTIQNLGYQDYRWLSGDHIIFNGRRYNFEDPKLSMNNPKSDPTIAHPSMGYSAVIRVNRADIRQGNNTVTFNIKGTNAADFFNVHLELPYLKSDSNKPAYTQPIQIFGQAFSNLAEPAMTNCDSYNLVEQDLDLPYLNGRANLVVGQCALFTHSPTHTANTTGNPNPLPAPDLIKPIVNMTAPTNNISVTNNNVTATANATDNVGISSVEFYLGNQRQSVDTQPPYEAVISLAGVTPGTYPIYAVAFDARSNFEQSSSVNIIKPADPDTTRPSVLMTAPENNTTVAQNAATLSLAANASDNVAVSGVRFYLDDVQYAQDTQSPYATTINLGNLADGPHTIYAIAFDAAGNNQQSSAITFIIPTVPAANCPVGQTGTPPNCVTPPPPSCPEGQTGTPPNCVTPPPPPKPTPIPNKLGDVDGDGVVGRTDLRIVLANYGRTVPNNTNGDLNGDGKVGRIDLRIVLTNYGR